MVKSNLPKLMEKKGFTLRKLAQVAGVAGETVNRARGERIFECRISTLAPLAKALGVKIKDLFDEN